MEWIFAKCLYFRSRVGVAGSADDRIGPGSDISLRWLYADFKNYGDRWDYSLVDNTPGIQLLNLGNVGCPTTSSGTTRDLRWRSRHGVRSSVNAACRS